jgi:hypothetical protein
MKNKFIAIDIAIKNNDKVLDFVKILNKQNKKLCLEIIII